MNHDPKTPPLLGLVKVLSEYAKTYEICGHGPDRIEVRRVSSLGGYATPVAVVVRADTQTPVWDFSGGAYEIGEDEQFAILHEVRRLPAFDPPDGSGR